jgi:hypothetical protein
MSQLTADPAALINDMYQGSSVTCAAEPVNANGLSWTERVTVQGVSEIRIAPFFFFFFFFRPLLGDYKSTAVCQLRSQLV